MQTMGKQNTLV
uniref:Uncharacterized protein n=1 Tax=Arundo donax TaxID=35708 RepID=A0A0A9C7E0_ARUDO